MEEGILDEFMIYNRDGVVKSPLLRHSRGGNPERVEMTGSKSTLISRLRGNDGMVQNLGFYEFINRNLCKSGLNSWVGYCRKK